MKKLRQLKNAIRGKSPDSRKNFTFSSDENSGYIIDLKNENDKDFTKLHHCCWIGDETKVRKYVKKIDVNSRDSHNRTPIHLAAAQGYKDIVMVLFENKADIEMKDSKGQTPLMKVVQCGHTDLLGILLGYGANVDVSDLNGNTALHIALEKERFDMSMILLQHNAAVNVENKDGNTPLHIAIIKKQVDVAKRILQKGALVNAQDVESQTPLILACKAGSLPLTLLLIEHEADPLLRDNMGQSAIDYSNISGDSQIAQLFAKDTAEEHHHPKICEDIESCETTEIEQPELDLDIPDSWNDSETTESSKKLSIAAKLLLPGDCQEEIQDSDKSINEMEHTVVSKSDFAANMISHSDELLSNENEGNDSENILVPNNNLKPCDMLSHSIEKIKEKKEDLFADLGFSDSVVSDESSSLHSSDDQKCDNEQVLRNNIDCDKGQNCDKTTEERKICSPSEELEVVEKNLFPELIFDSYIPSVTKRRFSFVPEGCGIKRQSLLNRRKTSLDISYANEKFLVSENTLESKNNFPLSSVKAKPRECGSSDVTEPDCECDWNSEDTDNENKDTKIKDIGHISASSSPLKEIRSYNSNMSEEENAIEHISLQNSRSYDGIISKNNSDPKVNAFPAGCNNVSEHWSTLGRPGTLQGSDEIWEENPRIKRLSSKHSRSTSENGENDTFQNNLMDERKNSSSVLEENDPNNEKIYSEINNGMEELKANSCESDKDSVKNEPEEKIYSETSNEMEELKAHLCESNKDSVRNKLEEKTCSETNNEMEELKAHSCESDKDSVKNKLEEKTCSETNNEMEELKAHSCESDKDSVRNKLEEKTCSETNNEMEELKAHLCESGKDSLRNKLGEKTCFETNNEMDELKACSCDKDFVKNRSEENEKNDYECIMPIEDRSINTLENISSVSFANGINSAINSLKGVTRSNSIEDESYQKCNFYQKIPSCEDQNESLIGVNSLVSNKDESDEIVNDKEELVDHDTSIEIYKDESLDINMELSSSVPYLKNKDENIETDNKNEKAFESGYTSNNIYEQINTMSRSHENSLDTLIIPDTNVEVVDILKEKIDCENTFSQHQITSCHNKILQSNSDGIYEKNSDLSFLNEDEVQNSIVLETSVKEKAYVNKMYIDIVPYNVENKKNTSNIEEAIQLHTAGNIVDDQVTVCYEEDLKDELPKSSTENQKYKSGIEDESIGLNSTKRMVECDAVYSKNSESTETPKTKQEIYELNLSENNFSQNIIPNNNVSRTQSIESEEKIKFVELNMAENLTNQISNIKNNSSEMKNTSSLNSIIKDKMEPTINIKQDTSEIVSDYCDKSSAIKRNCSSSEDNQFDISPEITCNNTATTLHISFDDKLIINKIKVNPLQDSEENFSEINDYYRSRNSTIQYANIKDDNNISCRSNASVNALENRTFPYDNISANKNVPSDNQTEGIQENQLVTNTCHQSVRNKGSKLTFRRLSVDQIISEGENAIKSENLRRKSFTEVGTVNKLNYKTDKSVRPLMRQNHYEEDSSCQERNKMLQNQNLSSDSDCSDTSGSISRYLGRNTKINRMYGTRSVKASLLSKESKNSERYNDSKTLRENNHSRSNFQSSAGSLLTSGWRGWYHGTSHKQLRRLSTSVINSECLEQIPERFEHRRLSFSFQKNTSEGDIIQDALNLDKFRKEKNISLADESANDVSRKQFRVAVTRSRSLSSFPNNKLPEKNLSSTVYDSSKADHSPDDKSRSHFASDHCTSLSDSVFDKETKEESSNSSSFKMDNLITSKPKCSNKPVKYSEENIQPQILLTSWEEEEDKNGKQILITKLGSSAKFPKHQLPKVNNKVLLADEDSSTTVTDTEEDKIQRKSDGVNSDLNEAPDDTLSISTDEELFHEEACDKNNALLHHSVTPSELAALQATVREQRLAVNKKNDKIRSLKIHRKTLQQEKVQLQDKLRIAISDIGLLKNKILDLKNQHSSLLYSMQEEKQNKENAEALLNAMKEKVSHKQNLYVNENKLRRSLENMLQSEKDEHNSANEIINLLQTELDKLRLQLEEQKKLVQDYEKKNLSLYLAEKSANMCQAEMNELKLELQQKKLLIQEYENKRFSFQTAEKATYTSMLQTETNELKLELEKMRKLVQEYEEKKSSPEMADKSINTIKQNNLDDEIFKLSEAFRSLQCENQRLSAQLQSTNTELQAKQHELGTISEKHIFQLKTIEIEKEALEIKAKLERDKEISLKKELDDMTEKMKNLNIECEKYKQTVDMLHKTVLLCQTSEESQHALSSYLEKLKLENKDLKLHLDEIKELHLCTKDVVQQGKEEAIDILSSINKQLEITRIELEEKSKEVNNLYMEIKQKEQFCFEKDLKIETLEQENNVLRAKTEMLNERLKECEKEKNSLQSAVEQRYKSCEVHTENNAEQVGEMFCKEGNILKMEKANLEKELIKEQQYSASLGSTLNLYKQSESTLHTQIQTLKRENQELQDNLCREKEHTCTLNFKLNAFNENLKKMEELITGLQRAKEEMESNRMVKDANKIKDKEVYSTCLPYDADAIIQLTEKLKDMEHLKNEKEALMLKEKRKALKATKSKKAADSLLQKEKQRIHQLMDVISNLKMELETANKKIKDMENLSNTPDQRVEQENWKSRTDELNAQIEKFRQQAEKEYNQRKEMEATCSLMKTELNSLRTVQTTLIEELLNELKSVKSQSQEQAAVACQMESWYKRAENINNEAIYNALKDISLQLKQRDSSADNTMKFNFAETKQKLMEELAQLKTTMKNKEEEYEILEEQRNRLHRNFEIQKPHEENLPYQAFPEQDVEIPVKLPNEHRTRSMFSDSFITNRRWSNGPHLISSSQQAREFLPQPISPIRDSQQFYRDNNSKAESDDSSSRLLPEIQLKLDNAIAKHLNSAPRVDISIPSHHNIDDNSTSSYMTSLQKKYFV